MGSPDVVMKYADLLSSLNYYLLYQVFIIIIHDYCLLGFPDSSVGKESVFSAGDSGWLLGWEDPLEKE